MTSRKLRSNFPRGSYLWSVRNAHWQALGIPEEDCEKPKIAIVNSSSNLAICFSHLDAIAKKMTEAIYASGGVAFEIRTFFRQRTQHCKSIIAGPNDFILFG